MPGESQDGVKAALDEDRALILGAQIILGGLYLAIFEPGFDRIPRHSQYLVLTGLALIVLAFVLLMWPVAYHIITDRGRNRPDFKRFVIGAMVPVLPLFGLALGLTLCVAIEKVMGRAGVLFAGISAVFAVTGGWFGLVAVHRRANGGMKARITMKGNSNHESRQEALADKITHVLTEARMVLPGAQALLGFQFTTMLMREFDRLPASSQQVHLFSLLLTACSTIVLMTPAAYHRLVEKGRNTETFYQLASTLVVAAMVPLALGIAAEFYVVIRKVTQSNAIAAAGAALVIAISFGLWFGFTLFRRARSTAVR